MKYLSSLSFALSALTAVNASPAAAVKQCAASNCFKAAAIPPALKPIVSEFCELYIHSTPGTLTHTVTCSHSTTVTPAQSTSTVTVVGSTTVVSSGSCSTTVTVPLQTVVFYPTRGANAKKRSAAATTPSVLTEGCQKEKLPALISSACSCFLTSKTVTSTKSTTSTITATISSSTCTSTGTVSVVGGPFSCGIANPSTLVASGSISCTSPAPPGQTNGRLRIEGGSEGTIFEDCIASGPEVVTTPSGGSHECDGTNNGANPNPGGTATTQLNNAAELDGFPFDGTFDSAFDDFFITSIDQTTETATQFWGLLVNEQFSPVGGCQEEYSSSDRVLWAFDAFNVEYFLTLSPDYMVVAAGTPSVTVTVKQNGNAFSGATIEGGTPSDGQGHSTIAVPTVPGCYQYKAMGSSSIRSNAFYLTVLPATS